MTGAGHVVGAANDAGYVRAQYETEAGLAARKAVYRDVSGLDACEVAIAAALELSPSSALEVGCGEGELAERLTTSLPGPVVALDQSARMVELTARRGVDARVGDVQELPFPDRCFDVAVAAWMLYHVPDLPRGIAEVARVLRPQGRLVAVTNAFDHLQELFALAGIEHRELAFGAENGAELLRASFRRVERRDAYGTVVFHDIDTVRSYFNSSERLAEHAGRLPARLDIPLVVRRRPVVLVADGPRS